MSRNSSVLTFWGIIDRCYANHIKCSMFILEDLYLDLFSQTFVMRNIFSLAMRHLKLRMGHRSHTMISTWARLILKSKVLLVSKINIPKDTYNTTQCAIKKVKDLWCHFYYFLNLNKISDSLIVIFFIFQKVCV